MTDVSQFFRQMPKHAGQDQPSVCPFTERNAPQPISPTEPWHHTPNAPDSGPLPLNNDTQLGQSKPNYDERDTAQFEWQSTAETGSPLVTATHFDPKSMPYEQRVKLVIGGLTLLSVLGILVPVLHGLFGDLTSPTDASVNHSEIPKTERLSHALIETPSAATMVTTLDHANAWTAAVTQLKLTASDHQDRANMQPDIARKTNTTSVELPLAPTRVQTGLTRVTPSQSEAIDAVQTTEWDTVTTAVGVRPIAERDRSFDRPTLTEQPRMIRTGAVISEYPKHNPASQDLGRAPVKFIGRTTENLQIAGAPPLAPSQEQRSPLGGSSTSAPSPSPKLRTVSHVSQRIAVLQPTQGPPTVEPLGPDSLPKFVASQPPLKSQKRDRRATTNTRAIKTTHQATMTEGTRSLLGRRDRTPSRTQQTGENGINLFGIYVPHQQPTWAADAFQAHN
jgi:hypothetical protein